MYVGLLTSPLDWDFEKVVKWAAVNGFKGMEVPVSPKGGQIDVEGVLKGKAGKVRSLLKESGVAISSLAFYSMSILESAEEQDFFMRTIEACSALDVGVACTIAGAVRGKGKRQTLREEFAEVFNKLADFAKANGVKIALENYFATLLQGLDHFRMAFESVPSEALGLNFDPSHLFWQQIDYLEAVHRFADRIYHTHAKDTEVLSFRLRNLGVLDEGWWRYRIPGRGGINWNAYVTALKEAGYDSVLSIEHEDPFFGPEEGFLEGKRFLESVIF
ncbi:MAG: sugar phosphate isomerase/epimerase [Candidatus Brockarchaeota archaeon]|nr:sugar phosphate isomerase/epimerase [Candidatus Brockarchaeota archaeon]